MLLSELPKLAGSPACSNWVIAQSSTWLLLWKCGHKVFTFLLSGSSHRLLNKAENVKSTFHHIHSSCSSLSAHLVPLVFQVGQNVCMGVVGNCFLCFLFSCVLNNLLSTLLFFLHKKRRGHGHTGYTHAHPRTNNSVISFTHCRLSILWPQVQDIPFPVICCHGSLYLRNDDRVCWQIIRALFQPQPSPALLPMWSKASHLPIHYLLFVLPLKCLENTPTSPHLYY